MQGGRLMTDEANMRSAAGLSVQGWRPSAQHSPICQQREALRFRQSRRQQSLTVCKAAPGQRKCRKLMESESSGSISWPQRLASFGAACVLTLGIVEVAGDVACFVDAGLICPRGCLGVRCRLAFGGSLLCSRSLDLSEPAFLIYFSDIVCRCRGS